MKFKGIVSDSRNYKFACSLHPSRSPYALPYSYWAGFCYRLDLGAASSESAAGSGRLRAAAVESAAVSVVALSCGLCVLVVGLDCCEVRLCDPCARACGAPVCPTCVSRVSPGSPRCLFTGSIHVQVRLT